MGCYETETQRVRKRLRETLTPRQKLANWWDYHKHLVITGAVLLVLALYLLLQDCPGPPADYTVGWVSSQGLEQKTAEAICEKLVQCGQDLNGDGYVQVDIHQMKLDLSSVLVNGTQGQQEYGELLALDADLEVGQSGIFLTDDPAALQAYTGALLYLDGTIPKAGAADWENMVISWDPEGAGRIYAGCRGCWKEEWKETWERYWQMWQGVQSALHE